jgi:hypothetical protein
MVIFQFWILGAMPERGLRYQGDWLFAKLGSMTGGGTKPAAGWNPPSQLNAGEKPSGLIRCGDAPNPSAQPRQKPPVTWFPAA